jgi:plastocyanin
MRIVSFAAAALLLLSGGAAPAAGPEKPARGKTHTVTMEGMRFHPDDLTVAPGETITWVNEDLVPHSATSETAGFDSKEVEAGKSWSVTVSKTGDFPYVCTLHRKMTAVLHVR